MIIVDGQKSELSLAQYQNLNDVLLELNSSDSLNTRIVTDVFINGEAFSELYPYHAEDVETSAISKLELCTVSSEEIVKSISEELPKALNILTVASVKIAHLFREEKIETGLDLLYGLIDMQREFIATCALLEEKLVNSVEGAIAIANKSFGELLDDISNAMEAGDWELVADLLEYEYAVRAKEWEGLLSSLHAKIEN